MTKLGHLIRFKNMPPLWMRRVIGCAVKDHRYESPEDAQHHLDGLVAISTAEDSARLVVYRCPSCEGWHVGHQRKAPGSGPRGT